MPRMGPSPEGSQGPQLLFPGGRAGSHEDRHNTSGAAVAEVFNETLDMPKWWPDSASGIPNLRNPGLGISDLSFGIWVTLKAKPIPITSGYYVSPGTSVAHIRALT